MSPDELADAWANADAPKRAIGIVDHKCRRCHTLKPAGEFGLANGQLKKVCSRCEYRRRSEAARRASERDAGLKPVPARLTCPLCGWKPSSEVWGSPYVLLREHRGSCSPDHGKPAGFDKGGMFR